MLLTAVTSAQSPDVPTVADLNMVLAVDNRTSSNGGPAGVLQGDYEMVVGIPNITANGITHTTSFEGVAMPAFSAKEV